MRYDVVVIGGGPAGLSGAVALGRALRTVLLIDGDDGRNSLAAGVHNYLTRDGASPAEFRALGRAEAERYGAVVRGGTVNAVSGVPDAFRIEVDGDVFEARRVLVATGVRDVLPEIPGVAERWGSTVLHCPYCHGYEARGTAIGIIATSPAAMHAALLWTQWTDDLVLFLNDNFRPDEEETAQLAAGGVRVVPGRVEAVTDEGVRISGGTVEPRDHLVVQTRLETRAEFLAQLGVKPMEHENGMGTYLPVEDASGRTTVPGVWVAGNVSDPLGQVVTSAAGGLAAGAMINTDLIMSDLAAATDKA